jgi:hypothetical protein
MQRRRLLRHQGQLVTVMTKRRALFKRTTLYGKLLCIETLFLRLGPGLYFAYVFVVILRRFDSICYRNRPFSLFLFGLMKYVIHTINPWNLD